MNSRSWHTPAVVLACGGLILMLALGMRQSFGLFLRPMSMDLGWGREAFSFAIALQNLVWGCAMPFAGAIADRYGGGVSSPLAASPTAPDWRRWRTRLHLSA